MSENANLRQNLQNVPSIFEISAAETLDNLIYPALSKIFDYFGLRLDFQLNGEQRVRQELSPALTWILQYLYLRKRGASFGESFYGLQRTATNTGEILTQRQQLISATILTFLPYFERKLKARSAQHEDTSKLESYLLNLLHFYNATKAVNIFLYLIKNARNHSPIFRALNLTLRYPAEPPKEDNTTYYILKLLEVLAFFLQFIQWWYSDAQRRKLGGTLRNPEPIEIPAPELRRDNTPAGDCPVCLMRIETPTACGLTGYVFCWKCIIMHLKKNSTCPVSGLAISLEDLIRIYEA